ncbi:alpha/beta hydrolase family protein [Paenibacillus sp. GCM10023252]|uniref:alpha/beta hydrolase family protein n=1 Tax=Paenibacillus sp. GCM10023252 TaxID=3252649 RepID=UPI00360E75EC
MESQLELQEIMKPARGGLRRRIAMRYQYDTGYARSAAAGVWTASSVMVLLAAAGMPTGLGTAFDCMAAIGVHTLASWLAGWAVATLLSLLPSLRMPRRLIGSSLYSGTVMFYMFYYSDISIPLSIMIGAAVVLAGLVVGCLLHLVLTLRLPIRTKLLLLSSLVLIPTAACGVYVAGLQGDYAVPAMSAQDSSAGGLDNPAKRGAYHYESFTYGRGNNSIASDGNDKVDLHSESVDASAYITRWPWLREAMWGFNERELPLNGRVWMPQEEGEYPLVLMVHGNHLAEDDSDGGYRYLGELLASRGFIAVSVDENFLNYSVWTGIPNQDMKVRAWLLLKHLEQLQAYEQTEGNPLFGRIDFTKVGLIGHSRGGQAVAMAADADRWFKDDSDLMDSMKEIRIQSVVALAPTDKQVDDTSAKLQDVNYLTLQGARDADVNNFYGERQYIRTAFSEGDGLRFKAAVYLPEANHSRFNTSWGLMDEKLPGGLLLNQSGMMTGEAQREAAKVYISAFMEATLRGEDGYKALMQDYRTGKHWLPDTEYITRYEDSSFTLLAGFEEDRDKRTATLNSGKAAGEDLRIWEETDALDRDRRKKGTRGVQLEWSESGGSYTLTFPSGQVSAFAKSGGKSAALSFSMANLERDLKARGEHQLPQIEMELTSRTGESMSLPLQEVKPVPPQPYTTFTILPSFEDHIKDNKYKESTEPVFQTYLVPLEKFRSNNGAVQAEEIVSITFRFQGGPGRVMLDDIGFASHIGGE